MASAHPDKLLLKITVTSVVLGICFVAFLILLFVSYKKNSDAEISDTFPTLSEETVLSISEQINEIKRIEDKRKENFQLNEKPFEDGDYSYDERTVDFRLVCKRDCPIPKETLDQEFAAIAYAVSTVRGLTQGDIDPSLMPFEVHVSEDDVCPTIKPYHNSQNIARAYRSSYTDINGNSRGLLCFFYDIFPYEDFERFYFPYTISVHETIHLFQQNKFPPYSGSGEILTEGVAMVVDSFFVKGNERNSFCWEGNNWFKSIQYNNPDDPHGTGQELFFELCNQYGFDYDDLPALFRELERRNGGVDEKEF